MTFKQQFLKFTVACFAVIVSLSANASWWEKGLEAYNTYKEEQKSSESGTDYSSAFSNEELQKAFKQALSIGSEEVVKQLSTLDAFNKDPQIHIDLPSGLKPVKSILEKYGQGGLLDDVELKINRAAELAAPKAKDLFIGAIQNLSFDDVQRIYQGSNDSATQYLKSKTIDKLRSEFTPIIEQSLSKVGALQAYDRLIANYKNQPFVPDIHADLQQHVVGESIDGLFYYLAKTEAEIRKDPMKQSTELLKKVFSSSKG
ncbi:DUF4197 domain-containing protein [Thiomicrorhabdus sp.]|uniref:DUF4197 domain-containing protein n=1 Tax=Thiomicrorhabdus sp. TaxID=2039724 RepID=UPI0029C7CD93|nr:DUF4197 domain-containing protein [Thiomicrorhabdus sp.]